MIIELKQPDVRRQASNQRLSNIQIITAAEAAEAAAAAAAEAISKQPPCQE